MALGTTHTNGTSDPSPPRRAGPTVNLLSISREALARAMNLDPRRSIEDECGHPDTGDLDAWRYQELYDRDAIAARVVQCMPSECWSVTPEVYEEEEADTETAFEEAWEDLAQRLEIYQYLHRADTQSGIGQYGVILLGLDDGLDLAQPARGVEEANSLPAGVEVDGEKRSPLPEPEYRDARGQPRVYAMNADPMQTSGRKLLYLRVFPETLAEIVQFEANPSSPRFGQPVLYLLSFNDPRSGQSAGRGQVTTSRYVHWTRVLHVADNLGASEVFGVPRMQPVLNRILDLRKVYGGDAEGFWKACVPILSVETDPALGGDVEVDDASARTAVEKLINGLQRVARFNGFSAKYLIPGVVDPTPHIAAQLQAIAIQLDIPQRVLMGSERGELASSQDARRWHSRVRGRQERYLTPRVIRPLVDRLQLVGALPPTPDGYCVDWPDVETQSDLEKADVALKTTQAMAAYVSGSVEQLVPPLDYLTRVHGWTKEEATAALESAEEHVAATQEADLELKQKEIARGLVADPTAPKVVQAPPGKALPDGRAQP